MKGIVFTAFLDMVETAFSPDMVDSIVQAAALPHGGAYTAVGTYPHAEMGRLVAELSARCGTPPAELLRHYGRHLFGHFHQEHGHFFDDVKDSFGFLARVEEVIHVEVRKLYPDAELPEFETTSVSEYHLRMTYRSPRCLGDFAEGLIQGCIAHFGDEIRLSRRDEPGGRTVVFELFRAP